MKDQIVVTGGEATGLYSFIPSSAEGDQIHAKLADRFKDGQIWMDEGDALKYLYVYIGGVVFFALNYLFWKKMLEVCKVKQYLQRKQQDQVFYLLQVAGLVHHYIVVSYSFYTMYYSCQSELGQATPSGKGSFSNSGQNFGWWRDGTCMMEMNKGYVYNLLITISYMCVELVIFQKEIKNPTILNTQTKWHHIMAITGYASAIFAGYGCTGIANASLICEVSSIFLNYKDMFTKDTRNSCLGMLNQLCFFVSFTLFRFVLFPVYVYRLFVVAVLALHLVNWFRKICMIFCVAQAICVLLLNLYWYKLILKGVKRLMQNAGILAKPDDDAFDDLAKYEADAQVQLLDEAQQDEAKKEEVEE